MRFVWPAIGVIVVGVAALQLLQINFNSYLEHGIKANASLAASSMELFRGLADEPRQMEEPHPVTLFAILRPDAFGNWFIQSDDDHAPYGISTYLEQTEDSIHVFFGGVVTAGRAGSVQITSDDGFGTLVSGHASLGLTSIRVEVWADGKAINPADVWEYAPENTNGNFWLTAHMFPEPSN